MFRVLIFLPVMCLLFGSRKRCVGILLCLYLTSLKRTNFVGVSYSFCFWELLFLVFFLMDFKDLTCLVLCFFVFWNPAFYSRSAL